MASVLQRLLSRSCFVMVGVFLKWREVGMVLSWLMVGGCATMGGGSPACNENGGGSTEAEWRCLLWEESSESESESGYGALRLCSCELVSICKDSVGGVVGTVMEALSSQSGFVSTTWGRDLSKSGGRAGSEAWGGYWQAGAVPAAQDRRTASGEVVHQGVVVTWVTHRVCAGLIIETPDHLIWDSTVILNNVRGTAGQWILLGFTRFETLYTRGANQVSPWVAGCHR
ncbi:hypothetical protein B0H14DRAFT_2625147 [Mycena olivaceomarginata]|nr:hypothetical protein B0H14DRAFT_2625147 [Mycena olivaceomarginata]